MISDGRKQTYIRFTLTMTEPGGVTTPAPLRRERADAVIATDAHGRAHIPGTSLAGALRAAVETSLTTDIANCWFGRVAGDAASASPIWVFDALIDGNEGEPPGGDGPDAIRQGINEGFARVEVEAEPPDPATHVLKEAWTDRREWMSTATDRHSGAARNRTLRQTQFLPAATTFTARLRWDSASTPDLWALVDVLAGWVPFIGRHASTGRGSCRVSDIKTGVLDLGNEQDLRRWLSSSGPALVDGVATTVATPSSGTKRRTRVIVSIPMRTVGPLSVGGRGQARRHTGSLPMRRMHTEQGKLRPVIPATAIKGVVRSRMEYILRSLGQHACLDQRCGRVDCLPCQCFGHAGGPRTSVSVGLRSPVRTENAFLEGREDPEDAILRTRIHVPLDRFTGGTARKSPTDAAIHPPTSSGGLLFRVEGVEAARFTLAFDVTALPDLYRADFLALLRLVIEDLHDGLIGFGHAVTRGYGTVEVDTGRQVNRGSDLQLPTTLPSGKQARKQIAAMLDRVLTEED